MWAGAGIAGARAQSEPPATQSTGAIWLKSQTWDYFFGKKRFGYSFDFIIRRQAGIESDNPVRHRLRESFRPWFVWQINANNRISLAPLSYHYDGGIRVDEASADGRFRHELRSTIELDSSNFLHDRVMLSYRLRYEFRHYWFPDPDDDYEFHMRLRLRLRARVSLNDKNFYDNHVIYAFGYNEVAVQYAGREPFYLNQNRSFLGAGYRFEKYLRIEAGYINQWVVRSTFVDYSRNHGMMMYFQVDYLSALLKRFKERPTRNLPPPPDPPPLPDAAPEGDPDDGLSAG